MVDIKTLFSVLGPVLSILSGAVGYYYKKLLDFRKIGIILPARILKNDKKFYKKGKFQKIPGWKDEYVSFKKRESPLLNALTNEDEELKNIRVVEEAGRGKTRTTLEVIRKLTKENSKFKECCTFFRGYFYTAGFNGM